MLKNLYKRTILQDKRIVGILCLVLMAAFLNNAPIKLIEGIVNQAVGNEERYVQQILWMGMLYLVAQILRAGIYARMEYATEKLQRKVGIQLQQELFRNLLSAEILDLKKLTSSELNNLLIEDVELVSGNSVLPIIKIVFSGISFLFALYFMLTINKIMPLIIIPLGLITSIIVKGIEKSSQQNGEQLKINSINMWKRFEEGIRGIFTLKLFGVTDEYKKVLEQGINQRNETVLQQSKLKSLSYFYLSSLFMITIGVILILSSLFVSEKSMTVGGLTAILMYNHILTDPLIEFHELYFVLVRLLASCKRIDKMLSIRKEENTERCSVDRVELEEVGFEFDQKTILRNMNLEFVKPCKKMIAGKTGSGKTTLVQIIAGLYPAQSGEVRYYYQGQRMQGKPRAICMMPDEYIFNMSIRDNILLFEKNVDEQRLAKILEITHLLDLVKLKGDFPVGEGGKDLSMGEQKRLLVARAIYREDYDLYIFDELTSSLDKTTAREILKSVIGFLENKICIFIEHNVEFAGYMDEVIEISGGSIRQICKN